MITKECLQDKLSNQFDLAMSFYRYPDNSQNDSCLVKVLINDKRTTEAIDSFSFASWYYSGATFRCENATSYTTGFNSNKEVVDNHPGDIVVADLNFDDKDDIALINDLTASSGPLYNYYIQDSTGRFKLDNYLTDSITFFPATIDRKNLRLTTFVWAGVCCVAKDVYQYDKTTKSWRHIRHKILRD
jgi:hypothetical protein